jgi:hypothetical protein
MDQAMTYVDQGPILNVVIGLNVFNLWKTSHASIIIILQASKLYVLEV